MLHPQAPGRCHFPATSPSSGTIAVTADRQTLSHTEGPAVGPPSPIGRLLGITRSVPATSLYRRTVLTGSSDTVLIVIRGNSGSGKSTVARTVGETYGRRGLALVSLSERLGDTMALDLG